MPLTEFIVFQSIHSKDQRFPTLINWRIYSRMTCLYSALQKKNNVKMVRYGAVQQVQVVRYGAVEIADRT
jgi:hypothetical protein